LISTDVSTSWWVTAASLGRREQCRRPERAGVTKTPLRARDRGRDVIGIAAREFASGRGGKKRAAAHRPACGLRVKFRQQIVGKRHHNLGHTESMAASIAVLRSISDL
jgi:hypothetical protein